MTTLSAAQVAQVAYNAGITNPGALATAVAIAWAESSNDPAAHNQIPPDDSYGLWQINMLGKLGDQRRQRFGLSSNDELFDPATNARAMVALSSGGTNWHPWSTYGGLRYYAALPGATVTARTVAAAGGVATAIGDTASSASDALSAPIDVAREGLSYVKAGATWFADRNNWYRILKVAIGAGLLLAGAAIVARPVVEPVVKTAAKTAKVAAVAA